MKLNKKGIASSSIIIVILLVLLVGSVGYICYDKFIKADEVKPTPTEEVKEKEVSVVDATNCVDQYWQGKVVSLVLPKIINGGSNAEKLNETILNDTLSRAYRDLVRDINDEANSQTLKTSYSYTEKDDVIMISILVKFYPWPASGSGNFHYYYFYNTKTDEILDVIQGLNAFGYSDDNLLKLANEKGRCHFVDENEKTYTIESLKKDFDFLTGSSFIDLDDSKNISIHISERCM